MKLMEIYCFIISGRIDKIINYTLNGVSRSRLYSESRRTRIDIDITVLKFILFGFLKNQRLSSSIIVDRGMKKLQNRIDLPNLGSHGSGFFKVQWREFSPAELN
jgi:hypothetical protein